MTTPNPRPAVPGLSAKDMNVANKEFVIELRIPLSGDEFAQAETILNGKIAIDAITAALPDTLAYVVRHETVTRRQAAAVTDSNGAAAPRRRKTVETQAPLPAGQ